MELHKGVCKAEAAVQSRQPVRHSAFSGVVARGSQGRPRAPHDHHTCSTSWAPCIVQRRRVSQAVAAPGVALSPGSSDAPEGTWGFLEWLNAAGVQGIGSYDSTVELCELGAGERGLVCSKAVAAGDVLLRIPYTLLLVDQPEDKVANMLMYPGAPGSVRLAARLLRERALGTASPWWPYISTLPSTVSCMINDFKTPADLDALEAPAMAQTLTGYATLLRDAYTKCSPEALAGASYEEFEWAMTVVASRCLEAGVWELLMWAQHDQGQQQGEQLGQQQGEQLGQQQGEQLGQQQGQQQGEQQGEQLGQQGQQQQQGQEGHNDMTAQHASHDDHHNHDTPDSHDTPRSDKTPPAAAASTSSTEWWAGGYMQLLLKVVNSRHLMTGTPNRAAGVAALRFLAPLLDMINHAPKPPAPDSGIPEQPGPRDNVRWSLQFNVNALAPSAAGARPGAGRQGGSGGFSGWEIQVVATRDLQQGDELHFCYRNEEGNDSFLLHYGFLPGCPAGSNPWDDVLLFPGGLEQALEWHCQEFVVKEDGIPLLQSLANDDLMLLYQEAFDAGNAALVQDDYAAKSASAPIKMSANGKAPKCLTAAFSAVMKGALELAGIKDEVPPEKPAQPTRPGQSRGTRGGMPTELDFSRPLPKAGVRGPPDSRVQAPPGFRKRVGPPPPAPAAPVAKPPKTPRRKSIAATHGEAAMARLCMQRLAAMAPVLQDLYAMSAQASQAVAAQSPAMTLGQHVSNVLQLQSAIELAKQLKAYQVSVEQAAEIVMEDALVLQAEDDVPPGQVPPMHLPSQGAVQLLQLAGVGSMDHAVGQLGFSYAAALAAGAQVEQQEDGSGASWPGVAGYVRQAPVMAAGSPTGVSTPDAAAASVGGVAAGAATGAGAGTSTRARQLAVQYRSNKKRILWDYLLSVHPKALQQALAVGIRLPPPVIEEPLLDYQQVYPQGEAVFDMTVETNLSQLDDTQGNQYWS